MNESERERYRSAYNRAARANPMTADCPPQWNADCIRDDAIEKETEVILDEYMEDPTLMAEMILENGYDQEHLTELTQDLCTMMKDDSLDYKIAFAETMMTFIELKAKEMATTEVDS